MQLVLTVPQPGNGGKRWWGAATDGTKVYFAPCQHQSILILDTATETMLLEHSTVSAAGDVEKWSGATMVGSKVFFAPYKNKHILELSIAGSGGITPIYSVRLIPSGGGDGTAKWSSAYTYGTKVYFGPCDHDHILELETTTDGLLTIDTGETGTYKWADSAMMGDVHSGVSKRTQIQPRRALSLL
eukprot:gene56967-biopygen31108